MISFNKELAVAPEDSVKESTELSKSIDDNRSLINLEAKEELNRLMQDFQKIHYNQITAVTLKNDSETHSQQNIPQLKDCQGKFFMTLTILKLNNICVSFSRYKENRTS